MAKAKNPKQKQKYKKKASRGSKARKQNCPCCTNMMLQMNSGSVS